VHFGLANFPVAYCGLKIITSLSLRFPDFQRMRCSDNPRGLSGPVVLQMSSYWHEGELINIDLLPAVDLQQALLTAQKDKTKVKLKNYLLQFFAKRLTPLFIANDLLECSLLDLSHKQIQLMAR
jgi:predicted flavoprotein YhiN